MEKQLEDKEIMAQLLEALNIKAYPFSLSLDNVARNTIYNILKGVHGFSNELIVKILDVYPKVNPNFLNKGIKPIFMDETDNPAFSQLMDILSLPQRIASIEKTQRRIEDKLDQLLRHNNVTNL